MFLLDTIHLSHKSVQLKRRFIQVERLLCDHRPDLVTRCTRLRRIKGTEKRGPRLSVEEKAETKKRKAQKKYEALKMGGIGRGSFRASGADEKAQKEWRIWWRVKTRHSANMVNAASEIWLRERGLQNWRHTRGSFKPWS